MPVAGSHKSEAAKFISAQEVELLIRAPKEAGALRDHYLLACLFYCALRVGEAVQLKPEHFDFAHKCVRVPTLKKRRWKKKKIKNAGGSVSIVPPSEEERAAARALPPPLLEIPILPEAEAPLQEVVAWAAGRQWIFPGSKKGSHLTTRTVENVFLRWTAALKLDPQYTPHSLRHSACSMIAAVTKDPVLVRDFARHGNVSTTNTYLHRGPGRWQAAAGSLGLGG